VAKELRTLFNVYTFTLHNGTISEHFDSPLESLVHNFIAHSSLRAHSS
jgi:hypothetical protein